jgi:hypothetical protein
MINLHLYSCTLYRPKDVRKRARIVRIPRKREVEGSFEFSEAWLGDIMIWPQAPRYKVAAGWIDLEPGSNLGGFPPPAPFADPDLALSFARLGASEEPSARAIEKWVSRYGLLFRCDEELPSDHILKDGKVNQKPMEVSEFTREVFRFRSLLRLYVEIRDMDVKAVKQRSFEPHSAVDRELAAYVLPGLSDEYPIWERMDRVLNAFPSLLIIDRVIALADHFLADQLSASLADVRLRMVPGFQMAYGVSGEEGERSQMRTWMEWRRTAIRSRYRRTAPSSRYRLAFSWHSPDLISAIYLQLFLLATKNTPMRFCESCQTPLPAKPKHKRFCNSTCRSNARNRR